MPSRQPLTAVPSMTTSLPRRNPPRWPHLLWALVVLTAAWYLGRAYENGQATASTAGAKAVWAQYEATMRFNQETLQRLHHHGEQPQD